MTEMNQSPQKSRELTDQDSCKFKLSYPALLNLSFEDKRECILCAAEKAAVTSKGTPRFFSINDIYRGCGFLPGKSSAWFSRYDIFPVPLIRSVLKSSGYKTESRKGGSSTLRYYLPTPPQHERQYLQLMEAK